MSEQRAEIIAVLESWREESLETASTRGGVFVREHARRTVPIEEREDTGAHVRPVRPCVYRGSR